MESVKWLVLNVMHAKTVINIKHHC